MEWVFNYLRLETILWICVKTKKSFSTSTNALHFKVIFRSIEQLQVPNNGNNDLRSTWIHRISLIYRHESSIISFLSLCWLTNGSFNCAMRRFFGWNIQDAPFLRPEIEHCWAFSLGKSYLIIKKMCWKQRQTYVNNNFFSLGAFVSDHSCMLVSLSLTIFSRCLSPPFRRAMCVLVFHLSHYAAKQWTKPLILKWPENQLMPCSRLRLQWRRRYPSFSLPEREAFVCSCACFEMWNAFFVWWSSNSSQSMYDESKKRLISMLRLTSSTQKHKR